jgi:hypothetical protein
MLLTMRFWLVIQSRYVCLVSKPPGPDKLHFAAVMRRRRPINDMLIDDFPNPTANLRNNGVLWFLKADNRCRATEIGITSLVMYNNSSTAIRTLFTSSH